jgi:hypothetical protein
VLFTDDIHAELDAFVTDKHGRTGDQLPDLMLALAAEGAVQRVLRVTTAGLCHNHSITESRGAARGRLALAKFRAGAESCKGRAGPALNLNATRAMKLYVLHLDQQLVKSAALS